MMTGIRTVDTVLWLAIAALGVATFATSGTAGRIVGIVWIVTVATLGISLTWQKPRGDRR